MQEAPLRGSDTARHLRDRGNVLDDAPQKCLVTPGIEAVEPAREEGDRRAAAGKGGTVRGTVDSIRSAGDDRVPAVDES